MGLREFIVEEIRRHGPIPFSRYMELCLYHPEWGYYARPHEKFGKAGDFYTSSDVHAVFGRLLARQFEELWRALGEPARLEIIELGPGRGLFARDVLDWSQKKLPKFFAALHYTMVESSSKLRLRLFDTLRDHISRGKVEVGEKAPVGRENAIVFANEFFDALPVHILVWRSDRWAERYVCLNGDTLAWCEGRPSSPAVKSFMGFYTNRGVDEESCQVRMGEVAPEAATWVRRIGKIIKRGELLVLDYAYTQREWEKGRFPEGTAMEYRKHRASQNLLDHPGEQDLTAHVNLSLLAEAGRTCWLLSDVAEEQGNFLLRLGEKPDFRDIFADCANDLRWQERARQLKTLIVPQGMGETFRVLQFRKR